MISHGCTGSETFFIEENPIYAAIEFDFDNDSVSFFSSRDSAFESHSFSGEELAQMFYHKGRSWTTAETSISVDSFSLIAIPEQSTYSLFAGVLVIGTAIIRRRK